MANDVKWIKITTDIFDDEKILMIESMPSADSIIVIWFKLLTFAGKQNNDGVFLMQNRIAYTDEMLASIFRRDINTVRLALKAFESFGMVEIVDNVITIPNWNKHQSLDSYEKKKQRDRLYQAERRAKQRALIAKSSDKSSDTSPDASPSVAISDKEVDIDIDINNNNNNATAQNSIFNIFESELARPLSPMEMDTILGWQLDHTDDLICEALNRAVKNDVKNLAYIGGILNDWLSNNVKTLDDVRKRDKERDKKKGSTKNARDTKPVNPYEGFNFGTVL